MDKLSFFGIITALLAIICSQYMEGANLSILLNLPAFIIVFGGTLGAVMLQTDSKTLFRSLSLLRWIIKPPVFSYQNAANKLVRFSKVAQAQGLLELDKSIVRERDKFLKNALNTLLSGVNASGVRHILEIELEGQEHVDMKAANVFTSMGGYSPTIGIVGAVLGLIQAMQVLHDQTALGFGIAAAFVATVYGVALANLVYLPIANKLKNLISERARYHEMIIEATIAIADGEHPAIIEQKLASFCYA